MAWMGGASSYSGLESRGHVRVTPDALRKHGHSSRHMARLRRIPRADGPPAFQTSNLPTMLTRRSFIRHSAAAAAIVQFPALLRSANPNSTLQIAAVGSAGKGLDDISQIGSHPAAKFVAFCD